jgi:hypothetical protein
MVASECATSVVQCDHGLVITHGAQFGRWLVGHGLRDEILG